MRRLALSLAIMALAIRVGADTLTVCASGCGYTTINAAYLAASASTTIQLNDDSITNESLIVANPIAGIVGAPGKIRYWGILTPGNILTYSAVGGATFTVNNIYFNSGYASSTVTNATIMNCFFYTLGNVSSIYACSGFNVFNTELYCPSSSGGERAIGCFDANVHKIINCTIKGYSIGMRATSTHPVVENCLFMGNATDLTFTSPAVITDATYSGFGQLPSGAGIGCIYGLATSREFVSYPNDLHLSPLALSLSAGVSVTGVSDGYDLDGIKWMYSPFTAPSIGCYQYVLPGGGRYGGR